ncbi:hypothetical protein OG320_23750 [Microbispora sp. NBC_01189]|uniref:hypothetical protein n=1 Tax=Microbispora sp. NBC_01189 TaxID=2903583 RepID=UPI002E15C68A|nr:hypothetical protein OG320_23750 [Microbispora sp. NBC_01189]
MELKDKDCWSLAETATHHPRPDATLPGPGTSWPEQVVLDEAGTWAIGHLGDGNPSNAVLITDETAEGKSSTDAAGGAYQYSGTHGTDTEVPDYLCSLLILIQDPSKYIYRSDNIPNIAMSAPSRGRAAIMSPMAWKRSEKIKIWGIAIGAAAVLVAGLWHGIFVPKPSDTAAPVSASNAAADQICRKLIRAAADESRALGALQDSIIEEDGRITGAKPDYKARYDAAVEAVQTARQSSATYRTIPRKIPSDQESKLHQLEADAKQMLDIDLHNLQRWLKQNKNPHAEWNQLTTYAANAADVASISCAAQ